MVNRFACADTDDQIGFFANRLAARQPVSPAPPTFGCDETVPFRPAFPQTGCRNVRRSSPALRLPRNIHAAPPQTTSSLRLALIAATASPTAPRLADGDPDGGHGGQKGLGIIPDYCTSCGRHKVTPVSAGSVSTRMALMQALMSCWADNTIQYLLTARCVVSRDTQIVALFVAVPGPAGGCDTSPGSNNNGIRLAVPSPRR